MDRSSIELSSEITAIGLFRPELADVLRVPMPENGGFPPGAPILDTLFSMADFGPSTELAALLAISDAWDFNQHKIDAARVDVDKLHEFLGRLDFADERLHDLAKFEAFRDAGFDFYFRPIGRLDWLELEDDHIYPARPPWRADYRELGSPVPGVRVTASGRSRREVGEALGWPDHRLRFLSNGGEMTFPLFHVIGAVESAAFAEIVDVAGISQGPWVDWRAVDVARLRVFLATLPNHYENLSALAEFEELRGFGFQFKVEIFNQPGTRSRTAVSGVPGLLGRAWRRLMRWVSS